MEIKSGLTRTIGPDETLAGASESSKLSTIFCVHFLNLIDIFASTPVVIVELIVVTCRRDLRSWEFRQW